MNVKKWIFIIIINACFLVSCSKVENNNPASNFRLEIGNGLLISNNQLRNYISEYFKIIESTNDSNAIMQIFIQGDYEHSTCTFNTLRRMGDYKKIPPTGLMYLNGKEILIYTPLNALFNIDSLILIKANKLAKRKLIDESVVQEGIHDYPTWKITFNGSYAPLINKEDIRSPYSPIIIDSIKFIPPKLETDEYQ